MMGPVGARLNPVNRAVTGVGSDACPVPSCAGMVAARTSEPPLLPSDLHAAVSRALGVPEPRVAAYARALREADLLPRLGRGAAAARMGPAECARLLVAVAGALGPSEAVAQVEAYGRTRVEDTTGRGVLNALGLEDGDISAVDAVARIVGAVAEGAMDRVLESQRVRPGQAASAFEATFNLSHPVRLQVRFTGFQGESARERVDYASPLPEGLMPRMRTLRAVGGESLVSLGRALRS